MGKSVQRRILDSFTGDEKTSEAKEYANSVYSSWKDVANTLSRNSILVLVLIGIFELLAFQRQNSTITIGSFTFADVPVVQIVLPAVVAVLLYDCIRLTGRWNDLQDAYCELMNIYAPELYKNDLDLFVKPSLPAVWSVGGTPRSGIITPSEKFIGNINLAVVFIVGLLFPLAFEAQAYIRLFQKFGYQDVLLWISLIVTVTFAVCTVTFIFIKDRED